MIAPGGLLLVGLLLVVPTYMQFRFQFFIGRAPKKSDHSEPAPSSAPSTGCLLLLYSVVDEPSTELIFGFT
jgi:hypothetical protein